MWPASWKGVGEEGGGGGEVGVSIFLVPHENGKSADVIKVRVGDDNAVEGVLGDELELRDGVRTWAFGVHACVEDEFA